ncbi:putative transposase [Deinococcus yavapaiensis KR-236]|uniref:Putative transposase n=1 Tax=Deinococcus yavapaiensis KR-236 TaxID=694435 RepID=A0A318S4J0_9DEIO|nr:putative transposase [Deinococcus yavapaiensis KR-236]
MVDPDATPHAQTPVKKRVVKFVRDQFGVSLRRACKMLGFHRSTQRYESQKDDAALENKLKQLAVDRPRFGYRRLHVLLRRDGEVVNHKRVYRVYRSLGLAVRKKTRRKGAAGGRVLTPPPGNRNERWSRIS